MSMSNIDNFYHKECNKIDANCINAYFEYELDESNPTGLCIHTPWGGECLDLKSIVKAGETVTTLHLSPEDGPSCLVFEREDGQSDCITGDELSRIISMAKLKDVDQSQTPREGDVYIYGNDGKFHTFNLGDYIESTNTVINNLNAEINNMKNKVNEMYSRWKLPKDVPDDAKIVLGNINLYSDENAAIDSNGNVTSLNKNNGFYGHDLDADRNKDEIFG